MLEAARLMDNVECASLLMAISWTYHYKIVRQSTHDITCGVLSSRNAVRSGRMKSASACQLSQRMRQAVQIATAQEPDYKRTQPASLRMEVCLYSHCPA